MTNISTSTNGFTVVTHVYPQQGGQVVTSPQNGAVTSARPSPSVSSMLGRFLKVDVIALGVIQIMIGLVFILLGIGLAFHASAVSTISGISFWGSIIYITAGSLTVSANKKPSSCLVIASLVMNIISTVTAVSGIILHCFDFGFFMIYQDCYYSSSNWDPVYYDCLAFRDMFQARSWGVAGVMLVLSLLEFAVSISVSVFASRATCSCYRDTQTIPHHGSSYYPTTSLPVASQGSLEPPFYPANCVPADGPRDIKVDNTAPLYPAVPL